MYDEEPRRVIHQPRASFAIGSSDGRGVGKIANLLQRGFKFIVLHNRPSGTRQRLAEALEKNRSFISQITNPSYLVPIPAQHLPAIFQICHFSPKEKQAFEEAYFKAHPRRVALVKAKPPQRVISLSVPDFGDTKKNREFDELLGQIAKKIADFKQDISQ